MRNVIPGHARKLFWPALMAGLCMAAPAYSQDAAVVLPTAGPSSIVGEYVYSQMELAAGIVLRPDGTFEYGLTVGSLDEHAAGRWQVLGNHIVLTSDPKPIAPTITSGPTGPAPGQPFSLRVLGPGGRDVPGVDFTIEFDAGEPLQSYSAGGPWSLPAEEKRSPRFVTFAMPAYRLQSARLPLAPQPGTIATFILTPNDFGEIDLTGIVAEIADNALVLHRPEGDMAFTRREAKAAPPS